MEYLMYVMGFLLQPASILFMVLGCMLGIVFGAIPGLTGALAIVLLLPITFTMEPNLAILLLMSIFVGGVSGGFISATLLGIPGSPGAIATCFDAYPLSQKGQTVKALSIGIIASFIGTFFSALVALFASQIIATQAVKLGPWEYFGLCFCAISLVVSLSKEDVLKGLAAAAIGMILGSVGMAPIDGYIRFSFGIPHIIGGFGMGAIMIGFFAIRQIIIDYGKDSIYLPDVDVGKISGFDLTLKEIWQNSSNIVRSLFIGLGIGFLPGMGAGVANLVSYAQAKSSCEYPEKFGKGCIDGIFATETSNNAAVGGTIIPLTSLGIPGDATSALLLAALTIQGIQPGPLLFANHPHIVYVMFGSMFFAAFVVLFLQYFGLRYFPLLLKIPYHYLYPAILLMCMVGAFSDTNTIYNIGILLFLGFVGIIMSMGGLPMPPLILAFILTPMLEINLRRGLTYSDTGILSFLTRPISAIFIVAAILSILWPFVKEHLRKRSSKIVQQCSIKKSQIG